MILSNSTLTGVSTNNSIFGDVDYELGTDTTSFPLADKIRYANKWYLRVGLWIWRASSGWKFDDKNASTLPSGTITLVNNQRDYAMPTNILSVERVRILDLSGKYHDLERKDISTIPDYGNEAAGVPRFWDMEGYSVILYPKPDTAQVTAAAGLQIYLSRQLTKFTTSDASTEPGFEEQWHDIISRGMCADFCRSKQLWERYAAFKSEIKDLKAELDDFYATRDEAERPRLKRAGVSYN